MKTKDLQKALIEGVSKDFREALQGRGNLPREDLEYLAAKVSTMKDERLKQCIAELIGWGDEQRAQLETSAAIAIEVMKSSTPSKLRAAAMKVEMRHYMRSGNEA